MVGSLGWLLGVAVSLVVAVLWIPQELWKRWRGRIADRIDRGLRRKVSRFDRRYREFVLGSLRYVDLKGLATVGFYTPELDEVFVDVSLAYRAPHQVSESVLAQLPAEVTDRHSIGDFLDRPQPLVLAVTGAPGSGKTTFLRHTARAVCQDRRGRRRGADPALPPRSRRGDRLDPRGHPGRVAARHPRTLRHRRTAEDRETGSPPSWKLLGGVHGVLTRFSLLVKETRDVIAHVVNVGPRIVQLRAHLPEILASERSDDHRRGHG
jgi:hypothetical protein